MRDKENADRHAGYPKRKTESKKAKAAIEENAPTQNEGRQQCRAGKKQDHCQSKLLQRLRDKPTQAVQLVVAEQLIFSVEAAHFIVAILRDGMGGCQM